LFYIDDDTAYKEFLQYLQEGPIVTKVASDVIHTQDYVVTVLPQYADLLEIAEGLLTKVEFSVEGYATSVVENQGYKFITFGGENERNYN